jgi:hypothetical protein
MLINNILGIYISIGAVYFLFARWIINIDWKWTIPIGYLISIITISLTIGIIDFGIFHYPYGTGREVRPFFSPLITNLSFIKNEYDLSDFLFLIRILVNGIISVILFESIYGLKNKFR